MTNASTAIVVYDAELAGPEHIALTGLLGGYRGLTRDAYALDLRQFVAFCDDHHLSLFDVRRSDIEAYGRELEARGTLTILRKGGKTVTIPLAPRTARAVDLAIGERDGGPIFIKGDGRRLDRHGARRIVRRVARRADIAKPIGPHTLRHAFITAALDTGVPLRRRPLPMLTHGPRCATTGPESPSIATPPTSCPPTSLALHADHPDVLGAGSLTGAQMPNLRDRRLRAANRSTSQSAMRAKTADRAPI
jgi:hypothetical protein